MNARAVARYLAMIACGVVVGIAGVLLFFESSDNDVDDGEEAELSAGEDAANDVDEAVVDAVVQAAQAGAEARKNVEETQPETDEPPTRTALEETPEEIWDSVILSPDGMITGRFRLQPPEGKQTADVSMTLVGGSGLHRSPYYTSYRVRDHDVSFASPVDLARRLEGRIEVMVDGEPVDSEVPEADAEDPDKVHGVGVHTTVEFDADEPVELTVRAPAVVSSSSEEEGAWSQQRLGVSPQIWVDDEPREKPVDVRLCLPGVDEFLELYGTDVITWSSRSPTVCETWQLGFDRGSLARPLSSSEDGCLFSRIDPNDPKGGVSSVEVTARRSNGCGEPGASRDEIDVHDQLTRWCTGRWAGLADVDEKMFGGDFVEDIVLPAMEMMKQEYDREQWEELRPFLRYWYEEKAAYYLGGYLRALRGDELDDASLQNCMDGVEAPDELDPEALDEAIDEVDEIRRRLEAKHEGAFEMATTETGVDLFGWKDTE